MKVPFNDLTRIHEPIIKECMDNFHDVVNRSAFVLNEEIFQFEDNFGKYCNQKYAISCANGTDALELILRGLGIGDGDEVIVPTNSFIATAIAVSKSGAKPIFVDNDEFYLIKTSEIETAISNKTKAIIAVNLYGQMVDMEALKNITEKYKIHLIEDAAQSHGAKNGDGKNVGDLSTAAAYSFYPGKNLGAWGDGGMVTTNSVDLKNNVTMIRNYGSKEKYVHDVVGFNSRLQPLQGIVLDKKLTYLNEWTEERIQIASKYTESFQNNNKLVIPKVFSNNYHVWHLYVLQVENRESFVDKAMKNGVQTIIHYPIPINKQKAYINNSSSKQKFENSDKFHKNLVSLPIFPKMKSKEITKVIDVVNMLTANA